MAEERNQVERPDYALGADVRKKRLGRQERLLRMVLGRRMSPTLIGLLVLNVMILLLIAASSAWSRQSAIITMLSILNLAFGLLIFELRERFRALVELLGGEDELRRRTSEVRPT
jgi:hypothetical protein